MRRGMTLAMRQRPILLWEELCWEEGCHVNEVRGACGHGVWVRLFFVVWGETTLTVRPFFSSFENYNLLSFCRLCDSPIFRES